MTTVETITRQPAPAFTVTITPRLIDRRVTKSGLKYTVIREDDDAMEGQDPKGITVMAFGESRDAISSKLRPGRPVKMLVQHCNGMLKLISLSKRAR